jgi:hypothetical protein
MFDTPVVVARKTRPVAFIGPVKSIVLLKFKGTFTPSQVRVRV